MAYLMTLRLLCVSGLCNPTFCVSFISPGRLSTSLDLLQTLWFTLHTADKKSNDVNGEEKHAVRLPPNLAQECALVCWALLEQLR